MATKKPTLSLKTPQALSQALDTLGALQRQSASLEAEQANDIAAVRAQYADDLAAQKSEIEALSDAIARYANKHRQQLLSDNPKHADVGSGTLAWKLSRAAVDISDEAEVIEHLQDIDRDDLLNYKVSVAKTSLAKHPELITELWIPHTSLWQKETLHIKPHDGREVKAPVDNHCLIACVEADA